MPKIEISRRREAKDGQKSLFKDRAVIMYLQSRRLKNKVCIR